MLALGLVAMLWARDTPAGGVFVRYLAGYGAIRFLVQFARGDDAEHPVLGLAHSQYAALVMLLVAALLRRWVARAA